MENIKKTHDILGHRRINRELGYRDLGYGILGAIGMYAPIIPYKPNAPEQYFMNDNIPPKHIPTNIGVYFYVHEGLHQLFQGLGDYQWIYWDDRDSMFHPGIWFIHKPTLLENLIGENNVKALSLFGAPFVDWLYSFPLALYGAKRIGEGKYDLKTIVPLAIGMTNLVGQTLMTTSSILFKTPSDYLKLANQTGLPLEIFLIPSVTAMTVSYLYGRHKYNQRKDCEVLGFLNERGSIQLEEINELYKEYKNRDKIEKIERLHSRQKIKMYQPWEEDAIENYQKYLVKNLKPKHKELFESARNEMKVRNEKFEQDLRHAENRDVDSFWTHFIEPINKSEFSKREITPRQSRKLYGTIVGKIGFEYRYGDRKKALDSFKHLLNEQNDIDFDEREVSKVFERFFIGNKYFPDEKNKKEWFYLGEPASIFGELINKPREMKAETPSSIEI
jgi:tetratricopeptide (TPR) repeat protein